MPAVVNGFQSFTTWPRDAGDWSCGQSRIVYDSATLDLLYFAWDTANNKIALYSSQNFGSTWALVAADASNASGSQPNQVMGLAMDSNGAVHCLSFSASNHLTYITRFTLTRSGGHVTNFAVDQSALQLPSHTPDNATDPRGNIFIGYFGGAEKVIWYYQMATTSGPNTDIHIYAGMMSALTGTASSVGVDGSGTDTQVYSVTGNANKGNHICSGHICQEKTSEHLYLYVGHFCSDYASGGGSSDYDLLGVQLAKGGSGWTAGSPSTLVSGSVGSVEPELMAACGTTGKAWVMYQHPTAGVSFGYYNSSGTYTDQPISSPLSTASRAGFGVFKADDSGRIWTIFNTYGSNGASPAGKLSYWDGAVWSHTTDTSATGAEGLAGCSNWPNGVAAVRFTGSTLAQTTSARDLATIYTPLGPTIVQQPNNPVALDGTTATFNYSASATSGTLTAQVQVSTNNGSSYSNVSGATSTASYTTGTNTLTDDGKLYRVAFTDDNGTIYSNAARLTVVSLGQRASAAFGMGAFGAGGFGAHNIQGQLGGAAAALAGDLQDVVAAAGALSTAIQAAANANGSATATGGLTTGIKPAGTAVDVVTATSDLSTAIRVAVNAIVQATSSGALTAAILLSGSSTSVVTSTATLNAGPAALAGAALDVVTASGPLSASIRLGGAASDVVSATGAATTLVQLAGAAQAINAAVAALTAQIKFVGNALDTALATGSLSGGAMLEGAAAVIATVSGSLATAVRLLTDAVNQVSAAGALSTGVQLGGNATDVVSASGQFPSQAVSLVGAAQSIVTALSLLSTSLKLNGNGQATFSASSALTSAIRLMGVSTISVTAVAALVGATQTSKARVVTVSRPLNNRTVYVSRPRALY